MNPTPTLTVFTEYLPRKILFGIVLLATIGVFFLKNYYASSGLYFYYLFFLSLSLSFLLTPLAEIISRRFQILDYPAERKVHTHPTPLLGGLAVYLAFAGVVLFNFQFSLELKGVVLGASLIFFLGLADDIRALPAFVRIMVQVIACLILIRCGVVLTFPASHLWWGKVLASLLTIVWVVGVTNSINFMDGLDGLVTGLGIIGSGFFLVIALNTGQTYLAYLSIILAGSLIGFLPYNFNPARLFLGDGGSTFIGFTLASLAIMGKWATDDPVRALGIPVLILSVPIFDIIYITVFRTIEGKTKNLKEWIEYVGKDHFHHRLLDLGFSQRETTFFIYFLSFTLGLGSLILREIAKHEVILIFGQVAFVLLSIAILMRVSRRKT